MPAASTKADSVGKKDIPQEETAVEHDPVDSQESSMIYSLASLSGKLPRDDFVAFPEADNSKGSDSDETTTTSSLEDLPEPDVVEHHWSHDLVLCASPAAISLPVSLEGRVIGLEKKIHELQEQTKSIQAGMTKLEAQLERVEELLRNLC